MNGDGSDPDGSNVTRLFGDRAASSERAAASSADAVILSGGDPDRIPVRITHLEQRRRWDRPVPAPHNARLGLLKLREVPVEFYKFLFHGVGREHHWALPPGKSDEELHENLNGPNTEVHVVYVGGAPAGFFELDLRKTQEAVTILCFGLMPYARGRGLGRWLLAEAIRAAWSHEPPRLRLQTNDHDSPIALRLYQSMGFEVTGRTEGYLIREPSE